MYGMYILQICKSHRYTDLNTNKSSVRGSCESLAGCERPLLKIVVFSYAFDNANSIHGNCISQTIKFKKNRMIQDLY